MLWRLLWPLELFFEVVGLFAPSAFDKIKRKKMKNIIYLSWFSIIMLFFSCKNQETGQEFHGLWQLVQTKDNKGATNYNSTNSHTLRFLSDNTYNGS